MASSSSPSEKITPAKGDRIERGSRTSDPLGTACWLVLRGLDPLLQYNMLARGLGSSLLHKVGLQPVAVFASTNTGIAFIDQLGLSPHRLVLLFMATGSTVKQLYWHMFCSLEPMPPGLAIPVSALNTAFNSLNSLMLTWSITSAALADNSNESNGSMPTRMLIGLTVYLIGIFTEAISERQRIIFKKNPKNEGKCYTGGLFSLARHINYGGYTLWRFGYSIAAGGFIWAFMVLTLILSDWTTRGVPALDHYCQQRVSNTVNMHLRIKYSS